MRRRRCLIFSGHPWDDLPYGLHHIAIELARRSWSVLFVETPFSPLHLVANRRRGRRWSGAPTPTQTEGLSVYSPFTLLPYMRVGPLESMWALTHWHRFTAPSISRLIGRSGFDEPDLFLMGSPLALSLRPQVHAGMSVYRLADDLSLLAPVGRSLVEAERRAISVCDTVIATSPRLEGLAHELGARRVVAVPNGVDVGHFSAPRTEPPEYAALPRPRIVYVGALERWVDGAAMLELARSRPRYSIVVIGPRGSADWLDAAPANVTWIGRRPYEGLPAYLQHADAGLVPFRDDGDDRFLNSINPIKLYEYRAAGLPAVIPERIGVESQDGAIVRYRGTGDFVRAVDEALALAGREGDSAAAHSWNGIVGNMLGELGFAI